MRGAAVPYAETAGAQQSDSSGQPKDVVIRIEGEAAIAKSSPTLYPTSERSSSAVSPYSASKVRINTIGGFNWRMPGQWIEWEVDVPESGLYHIGFTAQQNFVKGIYSTRKLTIDGEVPFAEMAKAPFRYQSDYRIDVMGGKEAYKFHLDKRKTFAAAGEQPRGFCTPYPQCGGQSVQLELHVPTHSDDYRHEA